MFPDLPGDGHVLVHGPIGWVVFGENTVGNPSQVVAREGVGHVVAHFVEGVLGRRFVERCSGQQHRVSVHVH